jgi:hypothetical protein
MRANLRLKEGKKQQDMPLSATRNRSGGDINQPCQRGA